MNDGDERLEALLVCIADQQRRAGLMLEACGDLMTVPAGYLQRDGHSHCACLNMFGLTCHDCRFRAALQHIAEVTVPCSVV
jgi:hypothetical protein